MMAQADEEFCQAKEPFHYKIKGQNRPFIDEDLQLQIPGFENQRYSPIYSHFTGQFPLSSSYIQEKEQEIRKVMAQAQQSYEAWKKMQQQLQEEIQKFKSLKK
jgi:NAD-specific glutamate dehydrogenase